jgi:hypothetical protein
MVTIQKAYEFFCVWIILRLRQERDRLLTSGSVETRQPTFRILIGGACDTYGGEKRCIHVVGGEIILYN